MRSQVLALAFAASVSLTKAAPINNGSSALPIVDLGYVHQQASSFDSVGDGYYNFSNIAFAQPPVGDLRWAAPQPPKLINGVQDGNGFKPICPQAYPFWLAAFLNNGSAIPRDLSHSEDCLYLDVFAPKKIFDNKSTRKAPVIVSIYGGGLVIGSKTTNNPRGLVKRSMQNTSSDGVISVAANYRLGNFGTLGGSDFESQGGAPNVNLLDQRMALDWVQKNVHLFGGDPDRVTLMGESGGASSIAHQITGNSALGHGSYPFKQVIMQSPAEIRPNSDELANKQFQDFLKQANASNLAELRKLDTQVLQQASYDLILPFPAGTFPYTYNVDNRVVRESARKQLLQDECVASDLKAIISYNLNEGFVFTPNPQVDNTNFTTYVKEWPPTLRNDQFKVLTEQMYPASAYASDTDRINTFIAEGLIDCNAAAYQQAFRDQAYAYQFSMPTPGLTIPPPGYHIQDLGYSFFDFNNKLVDTDVALDMQTRFVNFAVHGDPNAASGGVAMPVYGSGHKMLKYAGDGVSVVTDNNAFGINKRCFWWAALGN